MCINMEKFQKHHEWRKEDSKWYSSRYLSMRLLKAQNINVFFNIHIYYKAYIHNWLQYIPISGFCLLPGKKEEKKKGKQGFKMLVSLKEINLKQKNSSQGMVTCVRLFTLFCMFKKIWGLESLNKAHHKLSNNKTKIKYWQYNLDIKKLKWHILKCQ